MAGQYLWIILLAFVVLLALRVPVAHAMLLVCTGFIVLTGRFSLASIPMNIISGLGNYSVMCSPFFILVGFIMNYSGITERLFGFADCCVGWIPGGMGHVNVLSSLIFAGMSGSANADAAGLGNIEIHAMKERGYDADFSVGITAASSIIGPIFPPSNPMVLVGITCGISIGALFMGGVVVGIIMALLLGISVYVIARKRNYPVSPKVPLKQLWKEFRYSFWALMCPVVLLYCLQNGNITNTEAGVTAIVYAMAVSLLIYRNVKLKDMYPIFLKSINSVGLVLFLIGTGKIFSVVLGDQKIGEVLSNALFALSDNPYVILFLINIFLLFLGTFMETIAAITIAAPILFPIVTAMGMSPVQFGVIFVLNLMIGLLTPPMAVCLFITSKIGEISFERAFKATAPYYIALLLVLILINVFPAITLWLPDLLLGGYM